ncbi:hypothetical protein, conserved [Leishmania tarentolae]|uniref:Uncharacterized protein n=1 Tax=Leishmania tarentolae TaxID=5689 RepID=A0A640KLS0_LEITA|nr:hypothetical protein, conserved [Leishmania tarentolae]
MHRNRIRVRPAGGSHLASGTSSMAHMSYDSTNESFRDVRATAPQSAESPFAAQNSHTWNAQSPSLLYGADGSGGGWRYVRRIANLAYSTVSGVFGVLGVKPHGEVKASTDNTASTRAFPYSTAHPNISRISPATPAQSCSGAPPPSDETRVADTIELRRPRRSTAQSSLPPPKPPVSEQAPQTRDAPLSYPSVREAPQCQITVNQYFAAPERSIYPMVFTHPGEPASYRGAPAYPSRASLLTAPSSLQIHAKRPRLASPTAAATELRVRKAPKTVTDNDACDASLSNAPSAIPLGSQENSLTVPIGSLATTRLFGKAKTSNNDDASFSAKPAAPLADVPTAKAPLFGGTATPAAAAAAPNLFVFGSKPAEATSARSVAAAPTFGAPKTNSFVKAGPPAVMPDDSGFAPNADSDDDEKGNDKKTKTENSAPAKAPFSFSTAGAKPTFGAAPPSTGAPANPFSFSAKPAEKADTAAAPTFGAPKTNSFVKAGPPAVMPDDSGFAPNADSDDDEKGNDKKTKTENSAPAKAPFSFSTAGAKPTFGAAPPSTGAPANPFSFSAKPAEKADTAAAPTFGAPKTNSFVKAGPPAVMPDDSGFAPNADSDDDEKGNDKKTKTEGTTSGGSSGAFSFNVNTDRAKPNFGSGFAFGGSSSFGTSTGASGAAANPFSFPNPTPTGAFGASGSTGFSFTTSKK